MPDPFDEERLIALCIGIAMFMVLAYWTSTAVLS